MGGEAIFAGEENECFQLTSYEKTKNIPDFMKGATFYQIFPDRFNKSNTKKENVPTDRIIHENWDENPIYLPDERGEIKNNDFFGGDLKGITEKLDYIKSLGVSIIYLNPIFESHSNHRYDKVTRRSCLCPYCCNSTWSNSPKASTCRIVCSTAPRTPPTTAPLCSRSVLGFSGNSFSLIFLPRRPWTMPLSATTSQQKSQN